MNITDQARSYIKENILPLSYGSKWNIIDEGEELKSAIEYQMRFVRLFTPHYKYKIKKTSKRIVIDVSNLHMDWNYTHLLALGFRDDLEKLAIGQSETSHCKSFSRQRLSALLHAFAYYIGIEITIKSLPNKDYLITRTK